MPTPKQVRYQYARIAKLRRRLSEALTDAHEAGVIEYDSKRYYEDSPCPLIFEAWRRFKVTTEKACIAAFRSEIPDGD